MEQMVYEIKNDIQADEMLNQIMELKEEKARFEKIAAGRIEKVEQDLERQVNSIETQIQFNTSMLQAYFLTVPTKSIKTQRIYKLLSGKLIMKNSGVKLAHEDKLILEWAKENATEYVKQEPKLDWSKLKENLIIKDDVIVTKDGEVLDIEGLKLEYVNEQFEIKL